MATDEKGNQEIEINNRLDKANKVYEFMSFKTNTDKGLQSGVQTNLDVWVSNLRIV